jgi:hypothetical protein
VLAGASLGLSLGLSPLAVGCSAGELDGGDSLGTSPGRGGGHAADAVLDSILVGSFAPLIGYTGVSGRAQMIRSLDGTTSFDMQVAGLPASSQIMAHVHAAPCEYQGGGHYKIDPTVVETSEANELWFMLVSSAEGLATASRTFEHRTRGDALSIVVHDPATSSKMACADLELKGEWAARFGGPIAPFAAAEPVDEGIGGRVWGVRSAGGTAIVLAVSGLDPAARYASHVHALPCGVADAGGHYKIDPTVTDAVEGNELWLALGDHARGAAVAFLSSPHRIRTDAQSVVVHREVDAATRPKVACADLARVDRAPPVVTSGYATPLPAAIERGLDIEGAASMVRTLAAVTRVDVAVEGLAADVTYPAHVHALPCAIAAGGGHYKIDPARTDPAEDNEIWLALAADGGGDAYDAAEVAHTARAEAQSIVIHDPADGARLACIDLE